jgi:hypothetical protein
MTFEDVLAYITTALQHEKHILSNSLEPEEATRGSFVDKTWVPYDRLRYASETFLALKRVSPTLERIGNSNAILPMTTVASVRAYLLSTPAESGPNDWYQQHVFSRPLDAFVGRLRQPDSLRCCLSSVRLLGLPCVPLILPGRRTLAADERSQSSTRSQPRTYTESTRVRCAQKASRIPPRQTGS